MRRGLCWLALLGALAQATPAMAAELSLSEARVSGFPDRSYILTLPEKRALPDGAVRVSENGVPVEKVEVVAGGSSALVLAIDTSESMHGGAMDDAMAAAREFAARRRPDQPLGVVFFSREPRVVLRPTTDAAAIDRALAATPPLFKGTRIFDAADVAIAMVRDAELPTGAVVVLSDGADVGSRVEAAEVVASAKEARTRLFGVALRSRSFDPSALRALAVSGEYVEARSARDLARIFAGLGERLANEYVISYRSTAPLESNVAVSVEVGGLRGVATAAYQTPAFPASTGRGGQAAETSPWGSTIAAVAVAAIVALLLGLALFILVRPARKTIEQRIAPYIPEEHVEAFPAAKEESLVPMLTAADRALDRLKPWTNFKLDVEIAELRLSAIRILMLTSGVTVLLFGLFWMLLENRFLAVGFVIAVPVTARIVVAQMAARVRRKFEDQLPDNLQVLASALRAGHSFVGALNVMVADAPEPSRKEYRRVVTDEQIGISIEDSLNVVSERMRCEDVIYIGLIATLQRETGGNTAEVLDKVVETMRERAKLRRLVRTLTVQGRLGGWIVTALPIAMLVFLNLAQPSYMDPMTEETLGIVILIFAGVLVALGAYSIRRIVDIKV